MLNSDPRKTTYYIRKDGKVIFVRPSPILANNALTLNGRLMQCHGLLTYFAGTTGLDALKSKQYPEGHVVPNVITLERWEGQEPVTIDPYFPKKILNWKLTGKVIIEGIELRYAEHSSRDGENECYGIVHLKYDSITELDIDGPVVNIPEHENHPSLALEKYIVARKYKPQKELELARAFFDKMVDNDLINIYSIIFGEQVRMMLDPFPLDMVSSRSYSMTKVKLSSLKPTGTRWVECSRSIGPIIVDINPAPEEYPEWGEITVIEGKHRYLDAIERGEDTIWAWVGDLAKKKMSVVGTFDDGWFIFG